MPRREILTSSDRMQLLAFPEDEAELIRRYTLTKADLAFVRQHRGDPQSPRDCGTDVLSSLPRWVLRENERSPEHAPEQIVKEEDR